MIRAFHHSHDHHTVVAPDTDQILALVDVFKGRGFYQLVCHRRGDDNFVFVKICVPSRDQRKSFKKCVSRHNCVRIKSGVGIEGLKGDGIKGIGGLAVRIILPHSRIVYTVRSDCIAQLLRDTRIDRGINVEDAVIIRASYAFKISKRRAERTAHKHQHHREKHKSCSQYIVHPFLFGKASGISAYQRGAEAEQPSEMTAFKWLQIGHIDIPVLA